MSDNDKPPRNPTIHALKTWPESFEAVRLGIKRAEVRRDDRGGYQAGDTLRLREWNPGRTSSDGVYADGEYTGRELEVVVTHVLQPGPPTGLPAGVVLLSIVGLKSSWEILPLLTPSQKT